MKESSEPESRLVPPAEPSDRLRAFEEACRCGRRPQIEAYLEGLPATDIPSVVPKFAGIDARYRRSRGETPNADQYRQRFPDAKPEELAREIAAANDFGHEDVTIVKTGSEVATHRDQGAPQSKPMTCPQCGNSVALPSAPDHPAICEACGGSFRVQNLAEASTREQDVRAFGRFELLKQVGSGSFGAVWSARDTELKRQVALKIPHPSLLSSAHYRERLIREARAAAQLCHPGILRLYDVPTINGMPVLVTDFVDGLSLRDVMSSERLPFDTAASLVAETAEALDYAHRQGLIHRDIKPGNVMVRFAAPEPPNAAAAPEAGHRKRPGRWGNPIIVDFGLALRDEADIVLTVEGQIIGTPAYMSPEQVGHAHGVDRRTDVYSLGVILYELLCGELPFRGSKEMIIHQLLHEDPRPLRRMNHRIPRDLETICLKAMAKRPAWRYPSAAAMAADLQRYLRREPIVARPIGQVERAWRWCYRNPLVAALLSAVAGLLLAGMVGVWLFAVHKAQYAEQIEASRKDALAAGDQAVIAEKRRQQQWYDAEINLASQDLRDNRFDRMAQRLHQIAQPDGAEELRGFDWYYLARLSRLDLRTFTGHRGRVVCVDCSPNGRLVASSGDDGTIRIWDLVDGREVFALTGAEGRVNCLGFCADGEHLVAGGSDGVAWLCDLATGSQKELLRLKKPIMSLSMSRDGTLLALATGGTDVQGNWMAGETVFVDPYTGERRFGPVNDSCSFFRIALSPDGRTLSGILESSQGVTNVCFWDCRTLQKILALRRVSPSPKALVFSPTGETVAWAGRNEKLTVFDLKTRRVILSASGRSGGELHALAFSPDGRRLVTAGDDRTLKIWSADTGSELLTLTGHAGKVASVVFDRDGRRVVSGSYDGTVKAWDAAGSCRQPYTMPGSTAPVLCAAFDRTGRIACATGCRVLLWDAAARNVLRTISQPVSVHALAFSPDARFLAFGDGDGGVSIWDINSGRLQFHKRLHTKPVLGIAFGPTGEWLVSGGADGAVKVWRAVDGEPIASLPRCAPVKGVSLSSDGKLVAYGGQDGIVHVWSFDQSRMIREFQAHDRVVHCVAFHPSRHLLATGGSGESAFVWDAVTGEKRIELPGHAVGASAVCFSPDGRRMVTADLDRSVRVWDAGAGQELLQLAPHAGPITAVAFSPDGYRLATASTDRTLRLWDARPLTNELRDELEARSVTRFLASQNRAIDDMLKKIREDRTISETVREQALELAQGSR